LALLGLWAAVGCSGSGSPANGNPSDAASGTGDSGASPDAPPPGEAVSLPVLDSGPTPFYPRTDLPTGTVLVADLNAEVLAVGQDDDALYYIGFSDVAGGQEALGRLVKSGTAPPQTLAVVETLGFIAVDDSFAYFAQANGTVDRVPKLGGSVDVVASGRGMVAGMAVDSNTLYWTEYSIVGDAGPSSIDAGIWTMPKSGGAPVLAAPTAPTRFLATDGNGALAWDNDQGVFWSSGAGGAVANVQSGEANYFAPVIAGGAVFWLLPVGAGAIPTFYGWLPGSGQQDAQSGAFATVPFVPSAADGTGTQLSLGAGEAFTADGQSMYWAYDGAIFRVSVASGSIEQISSWAPKETSSACLVQESALPFLLVDESSVYAFDFWQDCTGLHGDIRAFAK
jgi:hypothetical protein